MTVNLVFLVSWSSKLSGLVVGSWYSAAGYFMERVMGIKIRYYGDLPTPEPCMHLSNHRSEIDYMFIWPLIEKFGLSPSYRFVMKDSLKYSPGFGWYGMACQYVFLKRNWEQDKKYLESYLNGSTSNSQIFMFPEGRIWNPDILAKRNLEQEHQFTYVLPPKTKGYEFFRKHLDTVYDITIRYPDMPDDFKYCMSHVFWGKIPDQVEVHFKRLHGNEIGDGKWLHQKYVEKDQFIKDEWTEQQDVQLSKYNNLKMVLFTSLTFLTMYGLTYLSLYRCYFILAHIGFITRAYIS